MTTWILVADTSRAKLFSTELRESEWSMIQEFEHPEGHKKSHDLAPSSPPGRMQQGATAGGHHTAVEPRSTPKEAETDRFAQRLTEHLEKATANRAFDSLVLVAPPQFLGLLKGTLGKQSATHLRTTVDKDLSMFGTIELRERLIDAVFPGSANSP